MAKIKQREAAIRLRIAGTSISDISEELSVSKSTVSYWCRDISLSAQAIQKIALRSNSKSTHALLAYTESLRTQRQDRIKVDMATGKKRLGRLTDRDHYCLGIGLYWGEGYKQGNQELGFTNSNPGIIIFYLDWLKRHFAVTSNDLILRVSINAQHRHRIDAVHAFWSRLTKISPNQFTAPSFITTVSKKQYSNETTHFGTLRIKVRRGTRMRREILGALAHLSDASLQNP